MGELEKMEYKVSKEANDIKIDVIKYMTMEGDSTKSDNFTQLFMDVIARFPGDGKTISLFFKNWTVGIVIKDANAFYSSVRTACFNLIKEVDEVLRPFFASVPCYFLSSKMFAQLERNFIARKNELRKSKTEVMSKPVENVNFKTVGKFLEAIDSEFPTLVPNCFVENTTDSQ